MNPLAVEQLRQERETFELNKRQAALWFGLRLYMGYCGLIMLTALAVTCGFIILSRTAYPPAVVEWAAAVLAGDILAALIATWKLVLSPSSVMNLDPVTEAPSRRHVKASSSAQGARKADLPKVS